MFQSAAFILVKPRTRFCGSVFFSRHSARSHRTNGSLRDLLFMTQNTFCSSLSLEQPTSDLRRCRALAIIRSMDDDDDNDDDDDDDDDDDEKDNNENNDDDDDNNDDDNGDNDNNGNRALSANSRSHS